MKDEELAHCWGRGEGDGDSDLQLKEDVESYLRCGWRGQHKKAWTPRLEGKEMAKRL